MKTKFSNKFDCIHAFAQRSQSEGRSSNVFFYGDKLYSYGYHYLLAEFIVNPSNERAIIINNEGYSKTTSKHISIVTQATRQYKQFFTMDVKEDNVKRTLRYLYQQLIKAKKPEIYINEANYLYSKYCAYCEYLQVLPEQEITHILYSFGTLTDEQRKEIVKAKKAEKQREKELERMEELEKISEFLTYETDYLHNMSEDYIRISLDQQSIETQANVLSYQLRKLKYYTSLLSKEKILKVFASEIIQ